MEFIIDDITYSQFTQIVVVEV